MSATLESQQIITRLKKEGKTVYNGGLGANPLPPPQILIDTFRENVHLKEYTTPDGIPEVNESVLNHYRSGPYQPTRCLFGNGLKELLFLVQVCFEGLIIHIHPSWVSYQEQTKLLDKKTVSITTTWTHNFLLQPSQLERVCKNYPDTPKLLIFNQPTNPTGIIYSPELYNKLERLSIVMMLLYLRTRFTVELYINKKIIVPCQNIVQQGFFVDLRYLRSMLRVDGVLDG